MKKLLIVFLLPQEIIRSLIEVLKYRLILLWHHKMRPIINLLIAIVFTSCNSLQSAYFNANTQRTFASSQAYIETVAKDTGLESSRIIILEDDAYKSIAADIVNDGLSTYYGIAYKSEIVSANELNIKSCQGQIIQLYRSIPDASNRFSKVGISSLHYLEGLHFNPEKKLLLYCIPINWGA